MWRMWRVSLMIVTHAHAHTCVKVNRETCHIRHNRHTRHPTTRFTFSHRCPLSLIPADLLAAPIVAAAVACRTSLGLTPADHAAAPSPALAARGGTEDAQPMSHWPPGHWRKRRYAADTPGDLWTTMQTPVSWADPAARPTAGAWCGNCENATWARDKRRADGGWCCSICHPADNVPVEHRDVVRW